MHLLTYYRMGMKQFDKNHPNALHDKLNSVQEEWREFRGEPSIAEMWDIIHTLGRVMEHVTGLWFWCLLAWPTVKKHALRMKQTGCPRSQRNCCGKCLSIVLCSILALTGCYSSEHQNRDVLSPQTVLANAEALLNHAITVRGTVTPGLRVFCTLMACPAENPCCNSCGADLQLCETENCITVSDADAGIQVGCFGNECGLTCVPVQQGAVHDISGVWRKHDSGEYVLELRSVSQRALF